MAFFAFFVKLHQLYGSITPLFFFSKKIFISVRYSVDHQDYIELKIIKIGSVLSEKKAVKKNLI